MYWFARGRFTTSEYYTTALPGWVRSFDDSPDSREMHDHLLRLDGWLGAFFDSLGKIVPRERTLIVLTSDYGMTSFPEYTAMVRHQSAGRMSLSARTQRAATDLRARYGTSFDLSFDNGILTADVASMRARGVNTDSLTRLFVAEAKALPGVATVYTPAQLASAPASDADANRWRRNLPPEIGWLIATVAKPNFVFSEKLSGEHGTMQPETVAIPIAFLGPGVHAGTYARVVRSVDIAPTLAALLGVRPMEALDGQVIAEVVSGAPPNP